MVQTAAQLMTSRKNSKIITRQGELKINCLLNSATIDNLRLFHYNYYLSLRRAQPNAIEIVVATWSLLQGRAYDNRLANLEGSSFKCHHLGGHVNF